MSGHWKAGVGALAAFLAVYLVRNYFGLAAAAVAVLLLLFAWWMLHTYTARRLDTLYKRFQDLDREQKHQVLGDLDPEIRRDFEKRIARDTKC